MISQEFIERIYPEIRFGGFSRFDGTVPFLARAHALAAHAAVMLEVGCGRAKAQDDRCEYRRRLHDFRAPGRHVIGIDVDPVGATNPWIDEFHQIGSDFRWPVADSSIDFAFSDYVLEHVAEPQAYFAELARVLKPGGTFIARTPSRNSYIAIAARIIPNSLHAKVVGKAQIGRKEEDVFPTVYRANTRSTLRRQLRQAGLEGAAYSVECEPWYMTFSPIAFRVMNQVHQLLPGFMRSTIIVVAQKPTVR